MSVQFSKNTIILPNGIKRVFKANVQTVLEIKELGWFILLDSSIPNNIYGLKPNGGLWWRLKNEEKMFVKEMNIINEKQLIIKTTDHQVYELNPQIGNLF